MRRPAPSLQARQAAPQAAVHMEGRCHFKPGVDTNQKKWAAFACTEVDFPEYIHECTSSLQREVRRLMRPAWRKVEDGPPELVKRRLFDQLFGLWPGSLQLQRVVAAERVGQWVEHERHWVAEVACNGLWP